MTLLYVIPVKSTVLINVLTLLNCLFVYCYLYLLLNLILVITIFKNHHEEKNTFFQIHQ